MSYDQHLQSASSIIARCAVITLSDTRTVETDKSGALTQELLTSNNHQVADYTIIKDEPADLLKVLDRIAAKDEIDLILTNGGTGISRRDQTIDTLERRLDRTIPGFGELFRMLSYQQIASGAMLSRAIGGIIGKQLVFAMPGSTKAVELAMKQLILPQVKHLIAELKK